MNSQANETTLALMLATGWMVTLLGIVAAQVCYYVGRRNAEKEFANRVLVQDEVLRNIVKQTKSMQDIAHDLRSIAKVAMEMDTVTGQEKRQGILSRDSIYGKRNES